MNKNPKTPKDNSDIMDGVVDALVKTGKKFAYTPSTMKSCHSELPSRQAVINMVEQLRSILFPGYFEPAGFSEEGMRFHVGSLLDRVSNTLQEQIKRGLCFVCELEEPSNACETQAKAATRTFVTRLPAVIELLATDVEAAFEGDPAARSRGETIYCYPGITAITNHRIAHELYNLDVPLIPRIINEYAHSMTGIDIHPGATIGEKFFIDHGTGVVIGETTIIGDNVRIYQGVTLGAKSFPLDEEGKPIKGIKRHPIIENDVTIYAGATILGRITIGHSTMVGGNVWITHDVKPESVIAQNRGNGKPT